MASASTQDSMKAKSPVADSMEYKQHESKLDKTETKGKSLYLFISDIGKTKIGVSSDPHQRVSAVRTSSPCKIELLNYFDVDDALGLESELHDEYEENQLNGEWFDLSNKQLKDVHIRMEESNKNRLDNKFDTPTSKKSSEKTDLEHIVELPDNLSKNILNTKQHRARFIAKNIDCFSLSITDEYTVESSEVRWAISRKENIDCNRKMSNRVLVALDELGEDETEMFTAPSGEKAVRFSEDLVHRML